ncbi:hypothetical protein LTS18_011276, partial [Coniosporium uncinatum]
MDTKSNDITNEREELDFILKSSVPGLVSDVKRSDSVIQAESPTASQEGGAAGHKVLVEPSIFNMGILLPPSLDFLKRLREVVPPGSDIVVTTLTSFLDDFLINVFLPQLEETLIDLSASTILEADAFQQDAQWSLHSQKPIFHGTSRFYNLISAFCTVLDNLPHDQAFSQLLIDQMVGYYDKCLSWYKVLVGRSAAHSSGRTLKAAATLAEGGEMHAVLLAMLEAGEDTSEDLINKEVHELLRMSRDDPLEGSDLIQDEKTITALCILHSSMRWLAAKFKQLRYISDSSTDSSRENPRRSQLQRRWTVVTSPDNLPQDGAVYLPLNQDTATAFDAALTSYTHLSTTVLLTLHAELRCRTLHHLSHALSTPLLLPLPVPDPDPSILTLTTSLASLDATLSSHLPDRQRAYLTTGLSSLIDALILSAFVPTSPSAPAQGEDGNHGNSNSNNSSSSNSGGKKEAPPATIKAMNANGSAKMHLSILILQQLLKTIETSTSSALSLSSSPFHSPNATSTHHLAKSTAFFDLFDAGAAAVV